MNNTLSTEQINAISLKLKCLFPNSNIIKEYDESTNKIDIAVKYNLKDKINELVYGISLNSDYIIFILSAIKYDKIKIFNRFIDNRDEDCDEIIVINIIKYNRLDIFIKYIDRLDFNINTTLMKAIKYKRIYMVKELLERMNKLDYIIYLQKSMEVNDKDLIYLFANKVENYSDLVELAAISNNNILNEYIDRLDFNIKGKELKIAIKYKNLELAKVFINKGIKLNNYSKTKVYIKNDKFIVKNIV